MIYTLVIVGAVFWGVSSINQNINTALVGLKAADLEGNAQPEPQVQPEPELGPEPGPEPEPEAPQINLAELAKGVASIGPEDAKVTVVEFSDFQCPYCGAAFGSHEELVAQLKARDPSWEAAIPKLKELAKEGTIRFVYRDFPLGFHQYAQKASEAARCAADQGSFWDYHDTLYENQDALDVDSLKQHAEDLGMDSEEFSSCLDSGKHGQAVKDDFDYGASIGVRGTPAFFINGELISGAQPFSVFEEAINGALGE